MNLEGKRVLVAGGSGFLGSAISRRFASCGADVGIGYSHRELAAKEVAEELRLVAGKAEAIRLDVRSFIW
mgnify:CR=1 FL=1